MLVRLVQTDDGVYGSFDVREFTYKYLSWNSMIRLLIQFNFALIFLTLSAAVSQRLPTVNYAATFTETINKITGCHFGWSRSQVKKVPMRSYYVFSLFPSTQWHDNIHPFNSFVISFDFIRQRQRSRRPMMMIPLPEQHTCKRTRIALLILHSIRHAIVHAHSHFLFRSVR